MNKNKFKIVVFTILTFGLIWIKWNKQTKHQSNTIYQVDKIPFDIKLLINYLGKDNYGEVEIKPSRIVIPVKNIKEVQLEKIKELKAVTGVVAKSNSLSIILGEFSSAVAKGLNYDKHN
ncbi:PTS glucose transporter subunit IIB [Mycoplasma hafezii]|uniref:PTS glucose transporter subunit IIB n=1 Tax=Mycoplasma hafezii TaxID=525886 RepID=UPI003CFBACA0